MADLKNVFCDTVNTKTETVEAWPEQVRELTVHEISSINKWAARIRDLSLRYSIDRVTPGQIQPAILDLIWVKWLEDNREDRPEADIVVPIIAHAFGWYLNDVFGMKWVEITDQYGKSAALRHSCGTTVHPRSSVEKRLESRGTGFFSDIFAVVESQIEGKA